MNLATTLEEFLSSKKISRDQWGSCDIRWEDLYAIGVEHSNQRGQLETTAELLSKTIQGFECVHSVRWRVKATMNLMEKIVRKRCDYARRKEQGEGAASLEKYMTISPSNYHEIVTDLVGIRALHLFKRDVFKIHQQLSENVTFLEGEKKIAYVRQGDSEDIRNEFARLGLAVEDHRAGYRSVHYIVQTKPFRKEVFAEVQVRTIFEEGWSEIDHTIKYPNLSQSPQLGAFLTMFSSIAGYADEMGSFAQNLKVSLETLQRKHDETISSMEGTLKELEETKLGEVTLREKVKHLQEELKKLKQRDPAIKIGGVQPPLWVGDIAPYLAQIDGAYWPNTFILDTANAAAGGSAQIDFLNRSAAVASSVPLDTLNRSAVAASSVPLLETLNRSAAAASTSIDIPQVLANLGPK